MEIDVRKIARLSMLALDEKDIPQLQKQMEDIVKMVEKLPEIQMEKLDLDPTKAMRLRKDEITPSLKRDELLANAPQVEAGCYVVPKTVE